jgi:hypothetical protein
MTAPHYVLPAREVSRRRSGNISAVDVHDYMLQRAKGKDHSMWSMMILMWLHLCAITNMFRDSERENDAELF